MSIIIPTYNRPKDLSELLSTIIEQTNPPLEVIIVDDSSDDATKSAVESFLPRFIAIGCILKHVRGTRDGLPEARNLGVSVSCGDVILFLDDDTILMNNTVKLLTNFLTEHTTVMGVQPKITSSERIKTISLTENLLNSFYKVFMCSYYKKDTSKIRSSGAYIFPLPAITKVIPTERLAGCCSCYRREVFHNLKFDCNLKRWAFSEDLDFSYRVSLDYPGSLFLLPNAEITHKLAATSRLPKKKAIYMQNIYWFYIFFKNMFNGSTANLLSFFLALIGQATSTFILAIYGKNIRYACWNLIYMGKSYVIALRNLQSILLRDLDFFNKTL